MTKPIAFVTGASTGIGYFTALALAKSGFNLIINSRRIEKLEALKAAIGTLAEVQLLAFDVRDFEVVSKAWDSLPEPWKKVDVLVNNAGNAYGLDSIENGKLEDWNAMIDINLKGLLHVTKVVLPGMIERKSGHIINLGSIAADQIYPNGNVYCASKSAVHALTTGMRMDLNKHSIKVSMVNPGMVKTDFSLVRFNGDVERSENVYKGVTPLTGEDIAEVICWVATAPKHVNIAETVVMPLDQASTTLYNRK